MNREQFMAETERDFVNSMKDEIWMMVNEDEEKYQESLKKFLAEYRDTPDFKAWVKHRESWHDEWEKFLRENQNNSLFGDLLKDLTSN